MSNRAKCSTCTNSVFRGSGFRLRKPALRAGLRTTYVGQHVQLLVYAQERCPSMNLQQCDTHLPHSRAQWCLGEITGSIPACPPARAYAQRCASHRRFDEGAPPLRCQGTHRQLHYSLSLVEHCGVAGWHSNWSAILPWHSNCSLFGDFQLIGAGLQTTRATRFPTNMQCPAAA